MINRHWRRLAWLVSAFLFILVVYRSSLPSVQAFPFANVLYLPLVIKAGPTAATTLTATPTATATPTVTATPTATAAPTLTILSNYSYFVDSINYLHVAGEVQNDTTSTLRFVKIIADFYNSQGQMIANDYTYTYLDDLPPNTKTCFLISLQQPTGWASFQFESPSYSTGGHALPNLTILNPVTSIDSYGDYKIVGMVRNDQGVLVKYVQTIGTLYDAAGKVLDCDFTYVNSTDLTAGQSSSFTMTFVLRSSYTNVASYQLQVDGSPQ